MQIRHMHTCELTRTRTNVTKRIQLRPHHPRKSCRFRERHRATDCGVEMQCAEMQNILANQYINSVLVYLGMTASQYDLNKFDRFIYIH